MSGIDFYRDPAIPFFELKLCGTGELSYKKHFHEEYSLAVVEQGISLVWYDGKYEEVGPGTLLLFPPNYPHECNPLDQENWQYKMLFIQPAWMNNVLALEALASPIIWRNDLENTYQDMMNQMVEVLTSQATPLEKESVMLEFISELVKSAMQWEDLTNTTGVEDGKIKRVKEYLQQHFREGVTLETLELVSGLTRFHLIHLFKKVFNIPPHSYQTLLRINFAKRELCKQRAISEVAMDVGFFDQSHFTKVFKNYVGVTPQKYQRSI